MSIPNFRLSLMAFPQLWENGTLSLNILLLPTSDPLQPLMVKPTIFAGTQLKLQAAIIPSLDDLPKPSSPTSPFPLTTAVPAGAKALFKQLEAQYQPVAIPLTQLNGPVRIRKALPQSYVDAFPFEKSRSLDTILDREYACAIRSQKPGKTTGPAPSKTVSWGQLMSYALRQPLVAEALGLLYRVTIPVKPDGLLQNGGWIYVQLDASDPAYPFVADWQAHPELVRSYAARLPALAAKPRALLAAVLFPVVENVPLPELYDNVAAEAIDYDDGFAKILHCNQPVSADAAVDDGRLVPATDAGVQIGWDDEQVTIWYNRQLDIARDRQNNTNNEAEAPLGVLGYRVDVSQVDPSQPLKIDWKSLVQVSGDLANGMKLDQNSEAAIEPAPVRVPDSGDEQPWLPRYFAQWRGKSLAVNDDDAYLLTGGVKPLSSSFLKAVLPDNLHLLYGQSYKFRVRLADLTGGGPSVQQDAINLAPAPVTTCDFRRHVPPKSVRIKTDPPAPALPTKNHPTPEMRPLKKISAWRPLLGYPEFTFAGVTDPGVVKALEAMVPDPNNGPLKEPLVLGVSDPDVESLQIVVEVRAPAGDEAETAPVEGGYRQVYVVERQFPALPADPLDDGQPLVLDLKYVDANVLDKVVVVGNTLPIPTARDVRIRLTALGHQHPDYFGSPEARIGLETSLIVRQEGIAEEHLFVDDMDVHQLNAIYLQPDNGLAQRLAQHLDLDVEGLTFSGHAGSRVVFGASAGLRHTLAPDRSSITFASQNELLNQWVAVMRVDLNRDWTWDGLSESGFEITRDGTTVGVLPLLRTINARALSTSGDPMLERRKVTHLVFFDAVNPNPPVGSFPREQNPAWALIPHFKPGSSAVPQPLNLTLTLPVTVNPTQTLQIASAGIALSPYLSSADYSSTTLRQRGLWLEFTETVQDDQDGVFGRVLGYGSDPLLSRVPVPEPEVPVDPPLAIDPELIRFITPGQSRDDAGMEAMTRLIPDTEGRHFLLPLPPGIEPDAPELFGFWTYEFRVGHVGQWSTAQGRFGRPLKVTGLQHPAPALSCTVYHEPERIIVTAPFATPVSLNGDKVLRDPFRDPPRSRLWILLYAQVVQADGQSHRNVLLMHRPAPPTIQEKSEDEYFLGKMQNVFGRAEFDGRMIKEMLWDLCLPFDSPLSILGVETLPSGTEEPADPLGEALGEVRILRTSPLYPVPPVCRVDLMKVPIMKKK